MACQAKVVLYAGANVISGLGSSVAHGVFTDLHSLGKNMFMGVLSVDLPSSTDHEVLSYDVIIREGTRERGLLDLGLLGAATARLEPSDKSELRLDVPLGYDEGVLPSFVLPSASPGALRFVHASCRKPHGGGQEEPDAIRLVDVQLAETRLINQAERPQQLILTGDQIYADDVAPGLLTLLTEAGHKLLGWEEPIPSVTANVTAESDFLVKPGWRTRYLSAVGLKELPPEGALDASASHLIRFGEWAAMYLFAWSDALWPVADTTIPVYAIPPPPSRLPEPAIHTLVSAAETVDVDLIPDGASKVTEVVKRLTEFDRKLVETWKQLNARVLGFAHSVRVARRVLANVATYMMFDDHEITDDWYLNGRVHDRLRGIGETGPKREVGPRMLRNGLSAYAFFQHWGNVPSDFEGNRQGAQLLEMWRHTGGNCQLKDGAPNSNPHAADQLLDIGQSVAGVPPRPAGSSTPASVESYRASFPRMRWDYAIDFGAHRLVVLDTRTWRFFPTSEPLTWASLAPKIPPVKGDAANHGAAELMQIADAWQLAGDAETHPALQRFADVVRAYRALSIEIRDAANDLQPRFSEMVSAFGAFLGEIPRRVQPLRDPVDSLLYDCMFNPGAIQSVFAGTIAAAREDVIRALRDAADFDFGADSDPLTRIFHALADFVDAALWRSAIGMTAAVSAIARNAGSDLGRILFNAPPNTPAVVQAVAAVQVTLAALDQVTAQIGIDQLATALFRNGDSRLAAGLIREDALPFMVTDPLRAIGPERKVTLLLSPAPIFGNRLVELAQRAKVLALVAQGRAGEEEMDFEAWSGNVPAMNSLFTAADEGGLECAIVLSGDVHYAGSSVNDVRVGSTYGRYLQLTSSSTRNSDGMTRGLSTLDDLLYSEDGKIYLVQTDWPTAVAGGASGLDHLKNLASAKFETLADSLSDAFDREQWERRFTYWWDSTPAVLDNVRATVMRVAQSPMGTARSVIDEVKWEVVSTVGTIKAAMNDPLLEVFGDFLSAGQPAREHLRAFYEELGLDPRTGLKTESTVIVDRRKERITPYPGLSARLSGKPSTIANQNSWQRRTVGDANAGFVKLVTRTNGDVLEVQHELRYYPIDAPANPVPPPITRTDWMGSLHRLGWYGLPADPGRSGVSP